jgi:apolipoprotein N-acyltransferase
VQDYLSPYEQWRRILQMVRPADLIVLPEAAVPSIPLSFTKMEALFKERFGEAAAPYFQEKKKALFNPFAAQTLSQCLQVPLVIGLDHSERGRFFNSAFYLSPQGEGTRYDKKILIPLAEYLPFQWLYSLAKRYGILDFFSHGKKTNLVQGALPLAVSICYEDTFPELMREGRRQGARLFVNVTNDGWYPHSKLAKQHFDHARVRAVENGIPLVRACNTGITGAVDAYGRILAALPEHQEDGTIYRGALAVKIDTCHFTTLYTLWGDAGIIFLSLALLFACCSKSPFKLRCLFLGETRML